jgi:hypothetical protein
MLEHEPGLLAGARVLRRQRGARPHRAHQPARGERRRRRQPPSTLPASARAACPMCRPGCSAQQHARTRLREPGRGRRAAGPGEGAGGGAGGARQQTPWPLRAGPGGVTRAARWQRWTVRQPRTCWSWCSGCSRAPPARSRARRRSTGARGPTRRAPAPPLREHGCLCVRVCVCARACTRVCVCVRVFVRMCPRAGLSGARGAGAAGARKPERVPLADRRQGDHDRGPLSPLPSRGPCRRRAPREAAREARGPRTGHDPSAGRRRASGAGWGAARSARCCATSTRGDFPPRRPLPPTRPRPVHGSRRRRPAAPAAWLRAGARRAAGPSMLRISGSSAASGCVRPAPRACRAPAAPRAAPGEAGAAARRR